MIFHKLSAHEVRNRVENIARFNFLDKYNCDETFFQHESDPFGGKQQNDTGNFCCPQNKGLTLSLIISEK